MNGIDQESWNRYIVERMRKRHERAIQREAVTWREWAAEMSEGLTEEQIAKAEEYLGIRNASR